MEHHDGAVHLGYQAINPTEVMEMANKVHKNIITATGKAHGINHHFNRGASPGNFSTEIIHHYTHNKNDGREKNI